jgi:hypothetical protein
MEDEVKKPGILQLKRSNGKMVWLNHESIVFFEQKKAARVEEIVIYLVDGSEMRVESTEQNLSKLLSLYTVS